MSAAIPSRARGKNPTSGRRRSAGFALLVSASLVLSACGSHRSTAEFAAVGTGASDATSVGTVDGAGSTGGGATGTGGTTGTTGSAPLAGTTSGTTGLAPSGATGTGGSTGGASGSTSGGTAPVVKRDKCATSGSTIKLGNISTQSGLLGELFKGLPEALQVWAKAANACGGLGGHPVQVISVDDGGDPSTALTLAKRLVEKEGVLAFIGLDQPLSVEGEADYLKKVGVPSIGGDSSEAPFFNNPVFFPGGPFVSVIGAATADIAIKHGKKKIAVFYCAEIPNSCGKTAASKFLQKGSETVRKLGGSVVLYQQASLTSASFTSQCLAARNAGADAVVAILDGPSDGRMAGDCKSQGYTPLFVGIGLGLSGNLTDYPDLNNNFFAPLQGFPWMDASNPSTKAYQDAMKKYYGRVIPGPSPAMGYLSGVLAQTAVASGLPAKPTSADIIKGLLSIKNNNLGGLTPHLTFTSQLPRRGVESCYFVVGIVNGKYAAPNGDSCIPIPVKDPA